MTDVQAVDSGIPGAGSSPESSTTPKFPAGPAEPSPLLPLSGIAQKSFWPAVSWLLGAVIGGVIGYFSAIMALKDDISAIRTDTSVISRDARYLGERLDRVEKQTEQIPAINTTIAVIQQRLQAVDEGTRQEPKTAP